MSEVQNSIFATTATPSAEIADMLANLDRFVTSDGIIITKALEGVGVKYSRAWLILRRAWLEANQPKLLWSPTAAQVAKAQKTYGDVDPKWLERHVFGPKCAELRDEGCSWGEIAVRVGKSESYCRKAFEAADGTKRSVGLRIGKGGRFAADRPDLYLENRKAEGAQVPNEKGVYASNVPVELLLNFAPAEV